MSDTVVYEKVDGHKIVTGFGRQVIEPVETRKKVDSLLKETEEFIAFETLKAEMATKHDEARAEFQKAQDAIRTRNASAESLHTKLWREKANEMQELIDQLPGASAALETRRKELFKTEVVYFEPKAGEEESTEEHIFMLHKKYQERSEGTLIDNNGNEVADLRGKVYYKKTSGTWATHRISSLGETVPPDGILPLDVSAAQMAEMETQRVSGLSSPAKEQELTDALNKALIEAENMDRSLEIQSDPDHMAKSQDWLTARQDELNALYA